MLSLRAPLLWLLGPIGPHADPATTRQESTELSAPLQRSAAVPAPDPNLRPTAAAPAPASDPLATRPDASPSNPTLARNIRDLKTRLVQEATLAIGMLELSTDALVRLDTAAAQSVMRRDDEIDREEVRIEEECHRLLSLFQPYARDFRTLATLLRVNSDLERVGDHAHSLAKLTLKLSTLMGPTPRPLPTALQELAQRVPMLCHGLLNALLTENADAARAILPKDKAIDSLEKRLFDECLEQMGSDRNTNAAGLLLYRCGRELERVGDLMTNIAEDVVYLATGQIVRHQKKRLRAETQSG